MTFPETQTGDSRPEASSAPTPAEHRCGQQTLHEARGRAEGHDDPRTQLRPPPAASCARGQGRPPLPAVDAEGRESFLEQSPRLGPQRRPRTGPPVVFFPFTGAIFGVSHSFSALKMDLGGPQEAGGTQELHEAAASGSHRSPRRKAGLSCLDIVSGERKSSPKPQQ